MPVIRLNEADEFYGHIVSSHLFCTEHKNTAASRLGGILKNSWCSIQGKSQDFYPWAGTA